MYYIPILVKKISDTLCLILTFFLYFKFESLLINILFPYILLQTLTSLTKILLDNAMLLGSHLIYFCIIILVILLGKLFIRKNKNFSLYWEEFTYQFLYISIYCISSTLWFIIFEKYFILKTINLCNLNVPHFYIKF